MSDANISSKVNVLVKEVESTVLSHASSAKSAVLSQMIEDTDRYVPYDTGELAKSVSKSPNLDGFDYSAPYASFAFDPIAPSGKPKVYNTDNHYDAQGNPWEASFDENMDKYEDMFTNKLLEGL